MEQLELKQVDIGYGGQPLIRNIDLSFLQGKMTCILGSNGAGKTTLFEDQSPGLSSRSAGQSV